MSYTSEVSVLEKKKGSAEGFPEEVKLAIKSLDNPVRQSVLMLLNNNNELSFSEIRRELQVNKLQLNFHLKNLFSSALIDHYYRHELGNSNYSYYSLTSLGKRIIAHLISAFIPPSPIQKIREPQSYFTDYSHPTSNLNDFSDVTFKITAATKHTLAINSDVFIDILKRTSNNSVVYQKAREL